MVLTSALSSSSMLIMKNYGLNRISRTPQMVTIRCSGADQSFIKSTPEKNSNVDFKSMVGLKGQNQRTLRMSALKCNENQTEISSRSGVGHLEEIAGLQAYVTGARNSNRAILFLSSVRVFDAPNLRNIADKVADAGFLVVVPDFFYGDPLDVHAPKIDQVAWFKVHNPEKGCENAKAAVDALKSNDVSAIGAAGFCWGGEAVSKLAKYDCIQAAVILHPGPLTVEDINEVKVPTALLGAEDDHLCPTEHLKYLGNILAAKPEVESFLKIYSGVKHAWSINYMPDDESAVKKAEEAHSDMLSWITKFI